MAIKIYSLINNNTSKPFYIGITANNLIIRLKQHIQEAFSYEYLPNKNKAKCEYINSVGHNISINLIGEVETISAGMRKEKQFINYYTSNGYDIKNIQFRV